VKLRYSFLFIFFLISCICRADDVGVSEVRLFEEDNNTYVLEVDVSPSLINTIQAPILPEHCSFIGSVRELSLPPSGLMAHPKGFSLIANWPDFVFR
jgi:hypothetical protein